MNEKGYRGATKRPVSVYKCFKLHTDYKERFSLQLSEPCLQSNSQNVNEIQSFKYLTILPMVMVSVALGIMLVFKFIRKVFERGCFFSPNGLTYGRQWLYICDP